MPARRVADEPDAVQLHLLAWLGHTSRTTGLQTVAPPTF